MSGKHKQDCICVNCVEQRGLAEIDKRTSSFAAPPCSAAVVSRERVMEVEAALMKAAQDFGRGWGCDQREHPRDYWLEMHIERWGELARCALAYADCFGEPPNAALCEVADKRRSD